MSLILGILLFIIAAITLLGTGGTASLVGVPRKPLTSEQAGSRILLGLVYTILFIWAGVLLVAH